MHASGIEPVKVRAFTIILHSQVNAGPAATSLQARLNYRSALPGEVPAIIRVIDRTHHLVEVRGHVDMTERIVQH